MPLNLPAPITDLPTGGCIFQCSSSPACGRAVSSIRSFALLQTPRVWDVEKGLRILEMSFGLGLVMGPRTNSMASDLFIVPTKTIRSRSYNGTIYSRLTGQRAEECDPKYLPSELLLQIPGSLVFHGRNRCSLIPHHLDPIEG